MAEKKENIHAGHRQRMWKKYEENGMNVLEPHEALEMLLYSCYPRRNTNDIAHELIKCFGNLGGVMNATREQLQATDNVGPSAALTITFLKDFMERMATETYCGMCFANTVLACEFAKKLCQGSVVETSYALILDDAQCLVSAHRLGTGTATQVNFDASSIAKAAFKHNCTKMMLLHNHPNGVAMFTAADVAETRRIAQTFANIGLELMDHILVAENETSSMRGLRLLPDIWY